MSVYEENGSIELGIMVHAETGERRVSINLLGETIILLNIEQTEDVINSLTDLLAEIKAQPYEVVGTLQ